MRVSPIIRFYLLALLFIVIASPSWSQSTFDHPNKLDSVKIFPNPATEYFIIETTQFPVSAAFVNDKGLIQGFIPIDGSRQKINVSDFDRGKYYLLISGNSYKITLD